MPKWKGEKSENKIYLSLFGSLNMCSFVANFFLHGTFINVIKGKYNLCSLGTT